MLLESPSLLGSWGWLVPIRGEGVRPKMVVCPVYGDRSGEKTVLGSISGFFWWGGFNSSPEENG